MKNYLQMKKRITAVFTAMSMIAGNLAYIPVTAMAETGSEKAGQNRIGVELENLTPGVDYVEGEIIVVYKPEDFKKAQEAVADKPLGAGFGGYGEVTDEAAADLLGQSEELMDVSCAAAALEAEDAGDSSDIVKDSSLYAGEEDKTVLRLIRSDEYSSKELIRMYEDYPGVIFAEPNRIYRTEEPDMVQESDGGDALNAVSAYPDLTHLQYAYGNGPGGIDVPDWNDETKENAEGVLAIVDSGVAYDHPDLKDVMWDKGLDYPELVALGGGKYGYNAAYERNGLPSSDPSYRAKHGTHCAGIMAAGWNGFGVSGAANGAKIMAIRQDEQMSDLFKAFNYIKTAKEAGVNIVAVNNSWGSLRDQSLILYYALRELTTHDIVCCFASGNENTNLDSNLGTGSCLSDIPGVLLVNNQTSYGEKAGSSNYGIRSTHIMSPGQWIMSTVTPENKAVIPDSSTSAPIPDQNGALALDDYESGKLYFEISPNVNKGNTVTVAEGALRITGDKLEDMRDIKDEVTKETLKALASTKVAFNYAEVPATFKARSPINVSENRTLFVALNVRSRDTKDAAYNVMFTAKTIDGTWDFFTSQLYPPGRQYLSLSLQLSRGILTGMPFDTENFEFRPVVVSSADTFRDIELKNLWITDADPLPYDYMNGTSMAAPAVTGSIAILEKAFPDDTAAMRAARILAGADRTEGARDLCITGGKADIRNSLDESTYTPVTEALTAEPSGLHLYGYFFGSEGDFEVSLKQGGLTFSTADDSLSIESFVKDKDGRYDVALTIPEGLKPGELTVTVINKAQQTGRTDYSRILELKDPEGYLTPFYTQLPLSDKLKDIVPLSLVALNDSLILNGFSEETDESQSFRCSPAGAGEWELLSVPVDQIRNGNVIAWNKKLLYIGPGGMLCIHDPETGEVEKGRIIFKDAMIEDYESYALYYDGNKVILLYTPVTDKEKGTTGQTEVWEVYPEQFTVRYLGSLKGSYGKDCPPVVAHDIADDGTTKAFYCFGFDSLSEGEVPVMESFVPGDTFTSEKISLTLPEGGDMIYASSPGNSYYGTAYKGGMMITGIYRLSDKKAMNPVILDDNYFISFSDPEHRLMPSGQRMAPTMMYKGKVCAYKGSAYMLGLQQGNSWTPALSLKRLDTYPAYGDQIVSPSDPGEATDKTVKLKKLTLSKKKLTLDSGDTGKLTAFPVFKEANAAASVTYGTSNKDVAIVGEDGTIYARDMGNALITAYCGNKTATCRVKVNGKAAPSLNKAETTLNEGEQDLLMLENYVSTGGEKITFMSSDTKVATVKNGLITAKKAGNADIIVTLKNGKDKKTFPCRVKVNGITVPKAETKDRAVKLSVEKSSLKLKRAEAAGLTATLKGAGYKSRSVVFTSLNPKVVDFGDAGTKVTVSGDALTETGGLGLAKVSLTGQSAGTAYVMIESYETAMGETSSKNRKLVRVTVTAPAESIICSGDSNSYAPGIKRDSDAYVIEMKPGSSVAAYYRLSPEVCTDFKKVKWKAEKGGEITVKNGIITARKISSKDASGKYIPKTVTLSCGDQKLEIKVIVK